MTPFFACLLLFGSLTTGVEGSCGDGRDLLRGEAALRGGDAAEAVTLLEDATQAFPRCGRAWVALAWGWVRTHREGRALHVLSRRDRPAEAAGAELARGIVLLQAGRGAEADRAFAEATRLDPEMGAAWSQRAARSLGRLGLGAAWEQAQRALACDPTDREAYRILERWIEASGDGAALRRLLDERLAAGQVDAIRGLGDLFFRLGVSRGRGGQAALAMAYYQQALRAYRFLGDAEGETTLLVNLGWLAHTGLRDSAAALRWFDEARTLAAERGQPAFEARARFNMGLVRAAEGDAPGAEDDFLHAVARSYGGAGEMLALRKKALKEIGDLRLGRGDLEGAADSYRAALEMETDRESLQAEAEALGAMANLARRLEGALAVLPAPAPDAPVERLSPDDPLAAAVASGDLGRTAAFARANPRDAARVAGRLEGRRQELVALAAVEYRRRAEALVGGDAATEVRTDHFVIRSDHPAPEGLRAVGRLLERSVVRYAQFLGDDPARPLDPPPTTVYLLSRREDYERLTEMLFFPTASTGHYAPEQGVIVLHLERERPESLAASAIHETIHMLNHQVLVPPGHGPPPWLDEGLAMYFALSRLDDRGDFHLGKVREGRERVAQTSVEREETTWLRGLRKALSAGRSLPIPEVVGQPSRDVFLGPDRHLYYAEAWTLVHFLLHGGDDARREAFLAYLDRLRSGEQGLEIEAVLGGDLASLESAWRDHVVYGL